MSESTNGRPNLRPVLRETFSDLEDMAAAMRNAAVELIPLDCGASFRAELIQVDLDLLTVQAHTGIPPHLTRSTMAPDVHPFVLLRKGGPCSFNGHTMYDSEVLHYRPGAEHFAHVTRPVAPAMIALPGARVAERWPVLTGSEPPRFAGACEVLRPEPGRLRHLLELIDTTIEIGMERPATFDIPEERRRLAEAIETTLILAVHEARHTSVSEAGSETYGRIVARADDVLRRRVDEPVYVAELCEALQVPERTLRRAFERTFAISPIRYLKLRRLGLVRRALCASDPAHTRVSDVASRYGFWEMGRFAGEYRRLFGEKPSETLRKARAQASPSTVR